MNTSDERHWKHLEKPEKAPFMIFTDLDGTLLDHFNYSFAAAQPALDELYKLGIPVILCSSKTVEEMQKIRTELGNTDPFIAENGAVIVAPGDDENLVEKFELAASRSTVIEILNKVGHGKHYRYRGFNDMDVEEVIKITGLSEYDARMAMKRQYTEPVLWNDTQEKLDELIELLAKENIQTVKGGRFVHFSRNADKGNAVEKLAQWYKDNFQVEPTLVALGDSENDLSMLEQVDIPVLVKSPVKEFPEFSHPSLIRTKYLGPKGWNQAIMDLLERLLE